MQFDFDGTKLFRMICYSLDLLQVSVLSTICAKDREKLVTSPVIHICNTDILY